MLADSHLSAQEAAEYLGVSRTTLYAYVSRGLIPSEPSAGQRSRSHRYPRRALESFKARREERRAPARGALAGGAPVLESSLSLIDRGQLFYRGQDAVALAATASLEEVAALLWTGSLEAAARLFPPRSAAGGRRQGRIGDRLFAALVRERAADPFSLAEPSEATLRAAGRTVAALFEAAGAVGTGRLAERLARGWRTPAGDHLRAALVLCADHELNASTFTARCVASTDAPLHNALLAALCALEGRRHGGVLDAGVHELLGDVERRGAARACAYALRRFGRLPGFAAAGDPPYPDGDPRARELLRRLALPPGSVTVRASARARRLGMLPTLDFALATLERQARLPRGAAFGLFALGRSVGWIAHALEQAATGRLIRPRAHYVGPPPTPPTPPS